MKRAFTLIELLIVVAIIAILAAIAVPNFLEAQTRAKVSRAKADMRSMATAIESYYVDNNRYPLVADEEGDPILPYPRSGTSSGPPEIFETRISTKITTPIAYITSLFPEPFPAQGNENDQYHYSTKAYAFALEKDEGVEEFEEYIFDISARPGSAIQYLLLSHGPDLDHDEGEGHDHSAKEGDDEEGAALYDPTNGTISSGDIVYFGPSMGFVN